ncbi:MAG: efflux RND transporter periplasmic adaptor subunit [Bacteroidetes bacterium]|nr:efflux RND transporter periplasmic adaptor subunit [Bacteroidota bacterium]
MYWTQQLSNRVWKTLVLFPLLVACKGKADPAKPKAAPPVVVDVLIAAPTTINNTVEASGTVVANEYVELRPEINGRITYLNVPEGKTIAKGTVLARIYDADLRATVEKSKVQLDLAQKTVDRYKKLLDIQGLNQSDYDAALNTVNGLKADIDYTNTLIEKTVIRAPFSGTVGLRQVSPGAFVTPSTLIATIVQTNKIKIDFVLPEEYSSLVHIGSQVQVETDAAGNTPRKAEIIAMEPLVNQTTRNLKVRALMDGGFANPGAFVKVYVGAGVDKKAVMVPTNAIIPDDKNNQLILVKGGKASFVNVKTGLRESSNVEIIKGVEPGDTVVVTGVLFARPKGVLKVRSVKTLEQLSK